MENLQVNNLEFRIRKMNALEILAFQTQISFDSYEDALKFYSLALENIELKVKDKWIIVKQGDLYYPTDLENNMPLMKTLIKYFMDYIKEVFQKSNG